MIEDYKARRLESVTASTVNRELDTIKNMLRKAVEWGYLKNSPAEHVKKLRAGKPHFRYLAADEIEKLLDACRRSDNPQLYPFIAVAPEHGNEAGRVDCSGMEGH